VSVDVGVAEEVVVGVGVSLGVAVFVGVKVNVTVGEAVLDAEGVGDGAARDGAGKGVEDSAGGWKVGRGVMVAGGIGLGGVGKNEATICPSTRGSTGGNRIVVVEA
jgi:hypothetical protein